MIRFFATANYDFLRFWKPVMSISAAFTVPGLLLLLVIGLNTGIDFTGGTLVQIETATPTSIATIRGALAGTPVEGAVIQSFGSNRAYVIRARLGEGVEQLDDVSGGTQATSEVVSAALTRELGEDGFTVERTEAVGPKVGNELREKALLAIVASFGAVLIYVAFRYEWRFGLAAVAATVHDIVASAAFVFYTRVEVSLLVVAALLTIVGYSLNDTIVIFDRVRENLKKYKREDLSAVLNRSVNETLPRTVLTSGTTMAVVLTLVIFAGGVLRPFSLVMAFGILIGTASSIYVASPVLMLIEQRWPGRDARGVRAISAPPGAEAAPAVSTNSDEPAERKQKRAVAQAGGRRSKSKRTSKRSESN